MKNTYRTKITILMLILTLSVIISACKPKEPKIDIEVQKTSFAQTAQVQATMTAEAQPTATLTPEPTLTPTLTSTATPGKPTATATTSGATQPPVSGNDSATWRAQTPPDNTVFKPGEKFTVTWTLENTGTSTWTTQYFIKFVSGEKMGAKDVVFLPYTVTPGTNAQISVDFVVPESEGIKRSDWVLKNANDQAFSTFYIVVEISESGQATVSTPTITSTP